MVSALLHLLSRCFHCSPSPWRTREVGVLCRCCFALMFGGRGQISQRVVKPGLALFQLEGSGSDMTPFPRGTELWADSHAVRLSVRNVQLCVHKMCCRRGCLPNATQG